MNYNVLTILILLSLNLRAQTIDTTDIDSNESIFKEIVNEHSIHFGQKIFLNKFIFGTNNISNSMNNYSLGMIGLIQTGIYYDFPAILMFTYLQPKLILANDSTKLKLNGFYYKFSVAGQTLINKKHFTCFLTEGLIFGRLKLANESSEKLKNPLFGPFLCAVFKLNFSKLNIFLLINSDFDISSKKWKKLYFSDPIDIKLKGFSQSGILPSIGINYEF